MLRTVLVFTVALCLWQGFTDAYQEVVKQYGVESDEDLPIILWWDAIMGDHNYTVKCGDETSCFVTTDKSRLHTRDVMLYAFYGGMFAQSGFPFPRRPNDLWALINQEGPGSRHYLFSWQSTMKMFNYTATFRRESHFPITTNWLPSINALTSKKYIVSTEEKNRLRREEGYAPVIFVQDHCKTQSDREGFVRELQKYIDVDSYGPCLNNKDFPEEFIHLRGTAMFRSPDFLKLIGRYKFAIAFENAICDDYITEKLWRPLEAGAVPIVHGSPTVKDFLPSEMSAIVVDDFNDIEELSVFLNQLDEDDDAYEEFLEYRDDEISNPLLTSDITRAPEERELPHNFMATLSQFECFLCDKLHEAIEKTDEGDPIPESVASEDHMGCPLPEKVFDENGKYVVSEEKQFENKFYRNLAKVLREYYDNSDKLTYAELFRQTVRRSDPRDEL